MTTVDAANRGVTVTAAQLHILQHSLGVDCYGQGEPYRNHFVTGEGCTNFHDCLALVDAGLMTRTPGTAITGGDDLFRVTEQGRAVVAQQSPEPQRSNDKRLTRSQRRYQAWLDADCGCSFGEWLAGWR